VSPPSSRSPDDEHWFEPLARHLGSAYLRYSFTRGTEQEVAALWDALGLTAGCRVLDVGCGPGRHALALAARGAEVVGVDISEAFLAVAREGAPPTARFERADARQLPYADEFDAVISLCQGAFGLNRTHGDAAPIDPDEAVLAGIRRALRPGGRAAVSAFSAYFQVRFLEDTDTFDAATGVNHERTSLRDPSGAELDADLWTTCFTPRELRLLADRAGLEVTDIWSVTPGDYRPRPPDLDHPEWLVFLKSPPKQASAVN
jgi:SAM-dependent methyltransferase